MVEILLDHGAKVDLVNEEGETALIKVQDVDIARLLIDRGANISAISRKGYTPLINFALSGNLDMVQLLINKGAEVNQQILSSKTGIYRSQTALMHNARAGDIDMIEKLLDNGAKVNLTSSIVRTETALQQAMESNLVIKKLKVAKKLINAGSNLKVSFQKTIFDYEEVKKSREMQEFIIDTLHTRIQKGYKDQRIEEEEYKIVKSLSTMPEYKDNQKLKDTFELFKQSLDIGSSSQVAKPLNRSSSHTEKEKERRREGFNKTETPNR